MRQSLLHTSNIILFALTLTWTQTATIAMGTELSPSIQKINGIEFQVADGLQVELVASEPLVKWPIVADWDQQGRLVVAESGGIARPVIEHNKLGLHKIIRLVDVNHDGRFDERLVAAEGLGFPEGVLCLGDSILVSIPPEIVKLSDLDGDGFCEEKEVWFDGQTITGCANDLHGPYYGRDGWIYWCKGAFAEQTHQLQNGQEIVSTAAHLFRCREDGSQLEVVMTGGMDNPVEMAFIPEGEKFFTSTFLQHPSQGLRDGIAHAVYGGLFGKDHGVLDGHTRTGPLLPIMTQLGPAAPSGLIYLEKKHLFNPNPDKPVNRLCSALFNLHKVCIHELVLKGSTYSTRDTDLVSTEKVDFHPTDVIEDADGSILILDTGGWYDLCCPTSRVDQKTAPGGIYRISSKLTEDIARVAKRQPAATHLEKPIIGLDSPQPWIQRETLRSLTKNNLIDEQVFQETIQSNVSLKTKLNCIWGLCALGTPEALRLCDQLLTSDIPAVAKVACHVVSLHRYRPSLPKLQKLLNHSNAAICRVASEAIGRIGKQVSVNAILNADHLGSEDRFVQHSLRHAYIEICRQHKDFKFPQMNLSDEQLATTVLVASQLNRVTEIDTDILFNALRSQNEELQSVVTDAICREPKLINRSMDSVKALWSEAITSKSSAIAAVKILSHSKDQPKTAAFILDLLSNAVTLHSSHQEILSQQLANFSPQKIDSHWLDQLLQWLKNCSPSVRNSIAESLSNLSLNSIDAMAISEALTLLAQDEQDIRIKLKLIRAIPNNGFELPTELESEILNDFITNTKNSRSLYMRAIDRCKLSGSGANILAEAIKLAQPQEMTTLIESIIRSNDLTAATQLLQNLAEIPASKTLPPDYLENAFRNSPEHLKQLAIATSKIIQIPNAGIKQSVEERLTSLSEGDPVRGLQLFRNSKFGCSSCHKMGYRGQQIGPDLTRIGNTRTPEALLEAILHPSSRIEQGYETTKILTADGRVLNGMVIDEESDTVTLRLTADRIEKLNKSNIELREPSSISIMPQGLGELLSDQELSDLLKLLISAK